MKKLVVIAGLVLAVLIVSGAIVYSVLFSAKSNKNDFYLNSSINLTKENFYLYLQQQELVQNLPKDAVISLKLYNVSSGTKQLEKSYIIKRASVIEGDLNNSDMEIAIDSKYLDDFSRDMCSAIKNASNNGEMTTEIKLSKTALLWKYKSMLGYKDCFGF